MKVFAALIGVVICSLWCGGTASIVVCSIDAAKSYAATTFLLSNPTCLSSLSDFLLFKNTTPSILSSVCTDNCAGVIYRWYLQNCQGNIIGLLNATLLSDACSKNGNDVYCAQAADNVNTTLLFGCATLINATKICNASNCSTTIRTSLSNLGCCFNSTTSNQTFAIVAPVLQTCNLAPAVGSCKQPFSATAPSPSPPPNAAAANTAAALVVYLALLYAYAAVSGEN